MRSARSRRPIRTRRRIWSDSSAGRWGVLLARYRRDWNWGQSEKSGSDHAKHKAAVHAAALYNVNQAPTPRLAQRSTPHVFPALSREPAYSLAQLGIVAPEFVWPRNLCCSNKTTNGPSSAVDICRLKPWHRSAIIPLSCCRLCPIHDRLKLRPINAMAPISYTTLWDTIAIQI